MSETMGMATPSDWGQFYQQNLSNQVTMFGDRVSHDATVVTTTVPSATTSASLGSGHLSPEGRVSKPIRRRSRASRRTPTTLLNTDTSNFRAMVQQFTGGPAAPFGSVPAGPQQNVQSFSFGFGAPAAARQGAVMLPTAGGYHLQYQQQLQNQQSLPYNMFSLSSNNNNNNNQIDQNLLVPRLGNLPRSDGFSMDGGGGGNMAPPSSGVAHQTSTTLSSSGENRSNTNFLF